MITEKARHDEWLYEQLKDPGFAAEYLTAAAEDEESVVFLQALRKGQSSLVDPRSGRPGDWGIEHGWTGLGENNHGLH